MISLGNNTFFVEAPSQDFPLCNCLYIKDDISVLIECSCDINQARSLVKEGVDIVINSHFHIDHMLMNRAFTESEIWIHKLDAPALKAVEMYQEMIGFNAFEDKSLGETFTTMYGLQPVKVHRELNGGEVIDLGRSKIRVIFAPGHSPGHCYLFEESLELLFYADITLSKYDPWYAAKSSDLSLFIKSIKACMDLNPKIVISAHDEVIYGGIKKRLQEYLDIIYKNEELLLKAMDRPLSVEDLAAKHLFYEVGRPIVSRYDDVFEKHMIIHHLKRFIDLKTVKKHDNLYYRV